MKKSQISLIPRPLQMTTGDGRFLLDRETVITAPATLGIALSLSAWLQEEAGVTIPVEAEGNGRDPDRHVIRFQLAKEAAAASESYRLSVDEAAVDLQAATKAGLFYGAQSLRQLLTAGDEGELYWPSVSIEDQPRFSWRGLHLDVGRHLFSLDFIKKFIDLMAQHKYNVFHWHLTDDQGWRIEIKQYPRLTEVGAWRSSTPFPADRTQGDGKPYGGFYTQNEIREIVAYAKDRFITVLPEIEMPGHAVAALASYPHLGCRGGDYQVRAKWGIAEDVFCAGNEETFSFLENVLREVFDLFPSQYIHIGGDECPKVRWQSCPKCQARIRDEGLADEHELQSYFVRRIERFVNEYGRRLVGWDEILEGGLAPNATVMSWRGIQGGIDAAAAGHDVIMTPTDHCYFDYYQSADTTSEPPAIGRFLPLNKVYAFDPVSGVPVGKTHHVLGGQGNVWTEYIQTPQQVEYMTYPRATALAEVLWSPPDNRDYQEFLGRLRPHLKRLDRLGVAYRPLSEG